MANLMSISELGDYLKNKEREHRENRDSSTHTHTQPDAPKKFITTTSYVIQPQKWRPAYDTEGPFADKTPEPGPCVAMTYVENGITRTYKGAYWTPLYPTWVAAKSSDIAQRLKNDGFKVLDVEVSHDAKYHYGGPWELKQCDPLAKQYTPCAFMKDDSFMQAHYGKDHLNRNWIKYQGEKTIEKNNDIELKLTIAQTSWNSRDRLINIFSIEAPEPEPAPTGKNKESRKTIAGNIQNRQVSSYLSDRSGHANALALAGRSNQCGIGSFGWM